MKGRGIRYSDEELGWLEDRQDWPRPMLHRFFVMFFERSDIKVEHIKSLCTRKGWKTGRTGCFAKGTVPPNKGKKMPFNANSAATRFKKGQVPANTKYLGHERLSKDGYVEISIAETNPHTGFHRRYVLKHRWLWEQINGPVPAGHCLKALDGNKGNPDPGNWECIPRALLPRLAGRHKLAYNDAPAELKPTVLAIAKVEHAAAIASGRRKRKTGTPGRPGRKAAFA